MVLNNREIYILWTSDRTIGASKVSTFIWKVKSISVPTHVSISMVTCYVSLCHIYPSELNVEKANNNNNRLYTKLYGKRDHFNFHFVNFPFLSSNIPSDP